MAWARTWCWPRLRRGQASCGWRGIWRLSTRATIERAPMRPMGRGGDTRAASAGACWRSLDRFRRMRFGRRISGRCFVTDGRRLILPAFGAFTGGLNVLDPAVAALLQPAFRVFMIGKQRLFAYQHHQLTPEPPRV